MELELEEALFTLFPEYVWVQIFERLDSISQRHLRRTVVHLKNHFKEIRV